MTVRALLLAIVAAAALPAPTAAQAPPVAAFRSPADAERALERRATELVLWGMPIVSFDAMRQAYRRDAGAQYNDIVYWSRPSDQFNQTTTPNSTSHYVYANINVKDGPVVFQMPPSGDLSMYGNLQSAWQVPVEDFGPGGIDKGMGGTFLLTPPGYQGPVPAGMRQVPMPTFNGYFLLRPTPRSADPRAAKIANALIGKLRLYPLAQAGAPPVQRFIDLSGKPFDAIVAMDDSFFDRLARILAEERAEPRDMVMTGMARSIGIGADGTFAPSPADRAVLKRAAAQARSELTGMVLSARTPWWPGSRWGTSAGLLQYAKDGFTYERDHALAVDDRARAFFYAYALPKQLGAASFYLTQGQDAQGRPLEGDRSYRLHVPASVPARDFWAINVYDLESSGFLRGARSVGTDSNRPDLVRNSDGSVDIVFSATPPKGARTNWVSLIPGHRWTAMFRLYGPGPALLDRSWRLPDIEAQP